MSVSQLEQGASFATTQTISATGVSDFTGYTITSQVRSMNGTWYSTLTATLSDIAGTVALSKASTADWPNEVLAGDVRFISPSGTINITAPFYVEVKKTFTKV
mgnify:FL=1|jgi:hypothetical protein